MTWKVYILRCSDDSLYVGCTNRLEFRLAAHNRGKGAKYTSGRRPVVLAYSEDAASHGAALKREIQLKKMSRSRKLTLIANGSLPLGKAVQGHR